MAGLTVSNVRTVGFDGRSHGRVLASMNFHPATLGSVTACHKIATATCLPRVFSYEDQETIKVGRALREAESFVDQ